MGAVLGGRWLLQQLGLHSYTYIHCSTVAPSCPLCFTGMLIDPAATECCKLIGYRIRQWWLNFGRRSLGLQYTCTSGQALTTSLLVSIVYAYNSFTYCTRQPAFV